MSERSRSYRRVVARSRDGRLIKGYVSPLLTAHQGDPSLAENEVDLLPENIELRPDPDSPALVVPRDSLKALFFVKSFEGNKEYNEIKFFEKNPTIRGLWVRVRFYDHESLEGIVENSLKFLLGPAFFLKPPDPQSNNEMLCVVKGSLVDFRVLGVKMDY